MADKQATPGREQMGSNIEPGLIARIAQGIKFVVTGVGPTDWFGPMQPLTPQAQDKTEGRAFDYPVGFNLRQTPRSGELFTFAQLRGIADGYDLLRLIIETRKDQIKAYKWELLPRDPAENAEQYADEIKVVTELLEMPDREHTWDDWLSMMVEDLLVIDAVCVYPAVDRKGDLYGFELVDGSTIKRVLDDQGRTPLPPSPAYQQVLHGIVTSDYSRETLFYMMRNPRTSRVYGYSPVEQVLMTVNIAMRRQLTQLGLYTEGNIPEAIAQAPETWTAKQIADFQIWWDGLHEGVIATKRRMTFVPSLKDIVFPRAAVIKDEYDEWLARICCFAFSLPPTAFVKQMNRATGEQAAETAKEEGLTPLLQWIATKMNLLMRCTKVADGLRFAWKDEKKTQPLEDAEVAHIYVTDKVKTPDEVREELGLDALSPEDREAAFPTPATPGFDEEGRPLPPAVDPSKPVEKPEVKGPTAAEKMLDKVLGMLDPKLVAEAMAKIAAAQPAVEVRPEFNVEVGDTNVHNSMPRPEPVQKVAPPAPPPAEAQVLRALRMADGSMVAEWQPRRDLKLVEKDGAPAWEIEK